MRPESSFLMAPNLYKSRFGIEVTTGNRWKRVAIEKKKKVLNIAKKKKKKTPVETNTKWKNIYLETVHSNDIK